MSSAGKYQLSKIKQLIDLNGDKVNFELNFFVKSTNNAPFEAIVLDQEALNSEQPIEYKNVDTGELTGNIVWNKNIYKNYFLVLKSKEPCECDVSIEIQEIEPEKPQVIPPEIVRPRAPVSAPVQEQPVQKPKRNKKDDDEGSSGGGGGIFRTILIIIAVIFAAYIGYWVYTTYFANKNAAPAGVGAPQVQLPAPQLQLPAPQVQLAAPQAQLPVPQVQLPVPQVQLPVAPPPVSDIVNRLNNLSM